MVKICPNSRPSVALIAPWSPGKKKGEQHYAQGSQEPNTDTTFSSVGERNCTVLSDKSCLIELLCEIFDGVSIGNVFFTIHVSAVIEVGISDQRNWMHESAGAEVIFEASWPLRSRVFNFFYSFVC